MPEQTHLLAVAALALLGSAATAHAVPATGIAGAMLEFG